MAISHFVIRSSRVPGLSARKDQAIVTMLQSWQQFGKHFRNPVGQVLRFQYHSGRAIGRIGQIMPQTDQRQ